MSASKDPFETLGISTLLMERFTAERDPEVIANFSNKLFRLLSQYMHPDVGGDTQAFQEIADAFEEISDDPLLVMNYYYGDIEKSKTEKKRAFNRSMEKEAAFKEKLIQSLGNTDPSLIVDWMENEEVVYTIGYPKSPDGLLAVRFAENDSPLIYDLLNENGSPSSTIKFDENSNTWKIISLINNAKFDDNFDIDTSKIKTKQIELAYGNKPQQIKIVGALNSGFYLESYDNSSKQIFNEFKSLGTIDTMASSNISTRALQWTDIDTAWWRDIFKVKADSNDPLVLAKVSDKGITFSVTGPPLISRPLT